MVDYRGSAGLADHFHHIKSGGPVLPFPAFKKEGGGLSKLAALAKINRFSGGAAILAPGFDLHYYQKFPALNDQIQLSHGVDQISGHYLIALLAQMTGSQIFSMASQFMSGIGH